MFGFVHLCVLLRSHSSCPLENSAELNRHTNLSWKEREVSVRGGGRGIKKGKWRMYCYITVGSLGTSLPSLSLLLCPSLSWLCCSCFVLGKRETGPSLTSVNTHRWSHAHTASLRLVTHTCSHFPCTAHDNTHVRMPVAMWRKMLDPPSSVEICIRADA